MSLRHPSMSELLYANEFICSAYISTLHNVDFGLDTRQILH